MARRLCLLLGLAATLAGCGGPPPVVLHPAGQPPARLSDWGVTASDGRRFSLRVDALPYTLNTPLFSDYALKLRAIWMPPGAAAEYREDGPFDFPVGTVISKTFYYPSAAGPAGEASPWTVQKVAATTAAPPASLDLEHNRLVETRLLVRYEAGWQAYPYVWNADQDEAFLALAGELRALRFDGNPEAFTYVVPDANQCAGCHVTDHASRRLQPIGPRAWQLNIAGTAGAEGQLNGWVRAGRLAGAPASYPAGIDWTDPETALADRARAYLDSNCAHCHNDRGAADTSGLDLRATVPAGRATGICKPPVAVGRGSGNRPWDIAPGEPGSSILLYRMAHTDPAIAMPELGRSTVHKEALELLSAWIASLPGRC